MAKKITLSKIREIALASFEKHGRFPSPQDLTTFDDVGYPGEAAGALNSSLRTGGRCLDMDPEWIELRNSLPQGTKPSLAMLDPANQLTLEKIRKLSLASMHLHGRFPSAIRNVKFDDVGYPGETSKSINSALKSGARGLIRDPEWRRFRDEMPRGSTPTLAALDPFHNLTLGQIRKITDASTALHGKFPSVAKKTSFADCGYPGETALALDSSMRLGGRGLDRDPEWIALRDSLPAGVVPTLASLDRLPFLTMAYIREVTEASTRKHGVFPSSLKNTHFDDVGYPGEKASAFDSSLGSGGRGLHRDPEWIEFRDSLPSGVKPSLPMLNPFNHLTVAKIREMATAYENKYGVFPSGVDSAKFDTVGYPRESVDSLNSTLRRGGRGLSRDPEWIALRDSLPPGGVPTFAMLDPFHNLTVDILKDIVLKSIELHRRVPTTAQKTCFDDVGYPGETASSLNSAIRRGGRGLSRDPQWIAMRDGLPAGKEPSLSMITAMVVTPALLRRGDGK